MTEEELWEESLPPSNIEEDVKPIVSVPCLLCFQTYDYNSEREMELRAKEVEQYTQHEIFSGFCKVLGVNMPDKVPNIWNLNEEQGDQGLLPFCKMCKVLLTSLVDVYSKLDELESVIKMKMMEGEQKYVGEEDIYGNLDESYITFRKKALGGLSKERDIRPSTSREKKAGCTSAPCSRQPDPPIEIPLSSDYQLRKRQRTPVFPTSTISPKDEVEYSDHELHDDDDDYESSSVSTDASLTSDDSDSDFGVSPKAKRRKGKCSGGTKSKLLSSKSSFVFIPEQKITVKIVPTPSQTVVNSARTQKLQSEIKESGSLTSSQPTTSASATVPSNPVLSIWSCKLCKNEPSFSSKKLMTEHWTTIHKISNQKQYEELLKLRTRKSRADGRSRFHTATGWVVECNNCSKLFSNCFSREWEDHQRSHKLEKMWGVEAKATCCQLCRDKPDFSSEELLNSHLATVHLIQDRKKYSGMIMQMIDRCKDGRKRYHTATGWITECDICMRPFSSNCSRDWKNHKWSHLSEAEKEEIIMLNGSRSRTDVLIPTEEQLSNGYLTQCPKCGLLIRGGTKRFKDHMLRHRSQEDEKLQYICNYCGKTYNDKHCFEKHTEKEHPDGLIQAPHKCEFPSCEQRFEEESSLHQHVSSEHGNSANIGKRRTCDMCGKVVYDSSNLKKHKTSVHFKEKPFECHVCSKNFASKKSMKDHLGSVHKVGDLVGKFKCDQPDCGKMFRVKSYLNDHLRKAHRQIKGKNKV